MKSNITSNTANTARKWAGGSAALLLLLALPHPAPAQGAPGGAFSSTGNMTTIRTVHTATLLPQRKVLVAGGFNPGVATFASAELFDPDTGVFSPTGSMATARRAPSATLLPNGTVLVAGGAVICCAVASAELYTLQPSCAFDATNRRCPGRS